MATQYPPPSMKAKVLQVLGSRGSLGHKARQEVIQKMNDLGKALFDTQKALTSKKKGGGNKQAQQALLQGLLAADPDWQNGMVPQASTSKMVGLIPTSFLEDRQKTILVLFNLEMLEELVMVRGVAPDRVYFVADTLAEYNMAKSIYGVHSKWVPKNLCTNTGTYLGTVDMQKVQSCILKGGYT